MIKTIYIKEFAIFDEINLDFKPGLTVVTGETGSGKSLLLQALSVSLGNKASNVMVNSKSERSIIETKIDNDYLRRIILKNGQSRCFVNDIPITIKELKKIKKAKIDFHSQHDQQSILETNNHIDYLDKFLGIEAKISKISKIYKQLNELNNELNEVKNNSSIILEKLELLNFQANEIDLVDPKLEEDLNLNNDYKKIVNSKEIIQKLKNIENEILLNDHCLLDKLSGIIRLLDSLLKYDSELENIIGLIKSSTIQIQEACSEINSKIENIVINEEELKRIEDRIFSLETIKRKYGGSIESIYKVRKEIDKEIKILKNIKSKENFLKQNIKKKQIQFSTMALEIHNIRKKKSKILSELIEENLADLNMENSKFEIKISNKESAIGFVKKNEKFIQANEKGIDEVEYYLSANPGEAIKPLAAIASGGETSRIMLALKKVFYSFDSINTIVFDEIDSGISGKTAEKVAKQLLEISKLKQVICITHLSQIALIADHHLHIVKNTKNNTTNVEMNYLNKIESNKVINELFYFSQLENN